MQNGPAQSLARREGSGKLAPGDVFVVVNETEQPLDIKAGIKGYGCYWHCDHALKIKAKIWTGDYGLLIGLGFEPKRRLVYVSSPQMSKIMAFDMEGNEVPVKLPPRRRYGNLVVDPTGRIVIGVHSAYGDPVDEDGHGTGTLVRFDPVGGDFEFFNNQVDGGRGGHHYVSNLALTHDGRVAFYVSEAGHRVCRYDLAERRQLPDFHVFDGGQDTTYGLGVLPSGDVIMATGIGVVRFDPSGRIIRRYDVPAVRGWTRARLAPDARHFYLGNFLEGVLQRRDIETGEIVAELDVQRKGALTAVVEPAPLDAQ